MTVESLIELLKITNPKAIVKAFDPNSDNVEEVTCILYDGAEVEIQTDEP